MKFKLSDVMDLIGGGTPKTSKSEYWNGTIPWLSVKDFNNGFRYVYETEKTITELGLENSSTKLCKRVMWLFPQEEQLVKLLQFLFQWLLINPVTGLEQKVE